ncbi:MAG: c-type cytochrome [Dokdonella sp.]
MSHNSSDTMVRAASFLFSFALANGLSAATDDPAAARPAQLGLCSACHGERGHALTAGIPHLAGQDESYLADALRQYRSGKRDSSAMRAVSGALQDRDVVDLARWYAMQKARP